MRKPLTLTAVALVGIATATWADRPQTHQMGQVESLAHDFEKAAHHVYESARSSHGHRHGTAAGALDRLHDLHERAKDFHKQVKRSHNDPAHTAMWTRICAG